MKQYLVLFLVLVSVFVCWVSAKFAYDPLTNTFSYSSDTVATGAKASTGTVATGVVTTGTTTTWTVTTGVTVYSGNADIAGLLKSLDSNTTNTLASFKSAYDQEYAKLSNAATDATAKGFMGMVMCFTTNPKSPDQLKTDLKNLYEASTKSLVEKTSLLAGQLAGLEKQLQYGTISVANLGLSLVGPRADIGVLGDSTKNGTKEFTAALASITQSFQSAIAKVASGSLAGSTGVIERYQQFSKLEQDYKDFSNKISLQGITLSNLPQLEAVQKSFVRVSALQYNAAVSKEILAYVPNALTKDADILFAIDKATRDYNDLNDKYSASLLQDLTQTKGITDASNAMAMIRAIYKPQSDILCNAFVENRYISEVGSKISTQMTDVLTALNVAANRVAIDKGVLVKDGSQLQQGYATSIASFAETSRISSLKTLKWLVADAVRAEKSSMLSKPRAVAVSVADQVAWFLAKKMQEYAAVGRLADFNALVTRAMEKIVSMKSSITNKKTLQTLTDIEAGMKAFQ